ncbi:hypothetical protein WwSim0512 [Wolbachia endosymbiont of Drosophila simulans]|nr:hypothetical protein WwSim0512 [Wolbachia endosymbiont of Drosophila simulans]
MSGCEITKSSVLTPSLRAYKTSNACSASINAHDPPFFCASAITCKARVVLPELSGPNISIIRPFGRPPTPRAESSAIDPVDIVSIFSTGFCFNFIIAPLPNAFSIWLIALSSAFCLSLFLSSGLLAIDHLLIYIILYDNQTRITCQGFSSIYVLFQ